MRVHSFIKSTVTGETKTWGHVPIKFYLQETGPRLWAMSADPRFI